MDTSKFVVITRFVNKCKWLELSILYTYNSFLFWKNVRYCVESIVFEIKKTQKSYVPTGDLDVGTVMPNIGPWGKHPYLVPDVAEAKPSAMASSAACWRFSATLRPNDYRTWLFFLSIHDSYGWTQKEQFTIFNPHEFNWHLFRYTLYSTALKVRTKRGFVHI